MHSIPSFMSLIRMLNEIGASVIHAHIEEQQWTSVHVLDQLWYPSRNGLDLGSQETVNPLRFPARSAEGSLSSF